MIRPCHAVDTGSGVLRPWRSVKKQGTLGTLNRGNDSSGPVWRQLLVGPSQQEVLEDLVQELSEIPAACPCQGPCQHQALEEQGLQNPWRCLGIQD